MKPLFAVGILILVALILAGCTTPSPGPSPVLPEPSDINISGTDQQNPNQIFFASFEPVSVSSEANIPAYELPPDLESIQNYEKVKQQLAIQEDALLKQNGFQIGPWVQNDDVVSFYKSLKTSDIPVFITSDSLLHLYHIQFDETLKDIEEREFFENIRQLSNAFLANSLQQYESYEGDLKEAAKRNAIYFSVGAKLLDPNAAIPSFAQEAVNKETALIEAHEGLKESPLFIYKEDYSQYVPRGHYTRSENLKKYFKAMMWYGRMSFLLKGSDNIAVGNQCESCEAFISTYDAKIQTIQANLIAGSMSSIQIGEKKAEELWTRIYAVTAFYVGTADDLTPSEYTDAMKTVFGNEFEASQLSEQQNIFNLTVELVKLRKPRIYGGTGECTIVVPDAGVTASPEELNKCLDKTQGLRLMGQRFIPDSYMFQNLVFPETGLLNTELLGNKPDPFTTCITPASDKGRCFPRGLDVMALLGSGTAKQILEEEGDTAYRSSTPNGQEVSYEIQFQKLKEEFDAVTQAEWNQNLYWAWLSALKTLVQEKDRAGNQAFMQTEAWKKKQLNAALGSWAQLRHDTILYAKQSYTPVEVTSAPPMEKPVVGYVEPVPEFFARLLELNDMTLKGLDSMNVLDEQSKNRLQSLSTILQKLKDLSEKELKNQELSEDEYEFIRSFGEQLDSAISNVETEGKQTTIIADVHTDLNTKEVLEEGTGKLQTILVAYQLPDNRILVCAGPVFSYYEFKHPMDDRLTDEKWKQILSGTEKPELQTWLQTIFAG